MFNTKDLRQQIAVLLEKLKISNPLLFLVLNIGIFSLMSIVQFKDVLGINIPEYVSVIVFLITTLGVFTSSSTYKDLPMTHPKKLKEIADQKEKSDNTEDKKIYVDL